MTRGQCSIRGAVFDYPALTTQPILESSMVTRAMAPSRSGGKPTQAVHRKGGRLAVADTLPQVIKVSALYYKKQSTIIT